MIPYEVENVRLRYYASNNAVGRATGLDVMLNGEFIDGIQSWMRMSFLNAQEDITDDGYYDYYNAAGELIVPGYSFDPVATDSTLVPAWLYPPRHRSALLAVHAVSGRDAGRARIQGAAEHFLRHRAALWPP